MLGNVAQLWRIIGELNLSELEDDLCRPVVVRLAASEGTLLEGVERLLGAPSSLAERVLLPENVPSTEADLELLIVPAHRAPNGHELAYARAATARGGLLVLARVQAAGGEAITATRALPSDTQVPESAEAGRASAGGTWAEDGLDMPTEHRLAWSLERPGEAVEQLVDLLGQNAPHFRLALARQVPSLRGAIAQKLIRETSTANAQFALVSSVPALLPIVGGFVGGLADSIVLTKNQALLLFKLAGIHGRDLSDKTRLLAEILPVVGGAFFWRTLARSLVGMLPALVSAAPKVGVAYVGTYVVGEMAHYYYRSGKRPSSETMQRFKEEGTRVFRGVAERIVSRGEGDSRVGERGSGGVGDSRSGEGASGRADDLDQGRGNSGAER